MIFWNAIFCAWYYWRLPHKLLDKYLKWRVKLPQSNCKLTTIHCIYINLFKFSKKNKTARIPISSLKVDIGTNFEKSEHGKIWWTISNINVKSLLQWIYAICWINSDGIILFFSSLIHVCLLFSFYKQLKVVWLHVWKRNSPVNNYAGHFQWLHYKQKK